MAASCWRAFDEINFFVFYNAFSFAFWKNHLCIYTNTMTEALKLAAVGLCAFFAVFWWQDNGPIPRMDNAVRGYMELQNSLPYIRDPGMGGGVWLRNICMCNTYEVSGCEINLDYKEKKHDGCKEEKRRSNWRQAMHCKIVAVMKQFQLRTHC